MGRERDISELEMLYRRRYSAFFRAAAAITNSTDDGREAVHDAFVEAIRHLDRYRGDGPLEAWVWRIVIRCASSSRRRHDRERADEHLSDVIWAETPGVPFPGLRSAIARLPERQRSALFLRYFADLDYESIARVMGIRVGTVGAELHAAHKSLRIFLANEAVA